MRVIRIQVTDLVIVVGGGDWDCDSLTLPPPPGAAPDALTQRRG